MKRVYATDERRSRSRPSTEKGPAKRLTHFSDGLLENRQLVIEAQRPTIDPARIYITGHSMGGLDTWDLPGRFPDRWAAALPMADFVDCANFPASTETMLALTTDTYNGDRMRFTRLDSESGSCVEAHNNPLRDVWALQTEVLRWMYGQVNDRLSE
ncbi:MAG: prolyl oligopeptidase family serine peptidase [Myxococcales bacterium]|nr:prolyl oligopeptidase family serine peptidase [Myxococcales bacterium]